MLDARGFPALVMVLAHVGALARQHLEVVRVVVGGVAVDMVHDLIRPQGPAKLQLSHGAVLVVEISCTWVSTSSIRHVATFQTDPAGRTL